MKKTPPSLPPHPNLPLDQILAGDCAQVLTSLPEDSVDLIFADPPYNLQLRQELRRPNQTLVSAVNDAWDKFSTFAEYDKFTRVWLTACRRVLKPTGTLWVIGSYHNIYRVGTILQDLGFWILNDVVWLKNNPMPNFRGVRFTNAHETLLWVQKEAGAPYTFNHHVMKALNGGLQMRSDWRLPICSGKERIRINGIKAHSTQKPEKLLDRVLLSSSNPGDVVLDPFFGTGTTGAVAKRLGRHWIGIERDAYYIEIARARIAALDSEPDTTAPPALPTPSEQQRITLKGLLKTGRLQAGQILYFGSNGGPTALINTAGKVEYQGKSGSIHQMARLVNQSARNGWECWYYEDETLTRRPLNHLRLSLLNSPQSIEETL